MRTVSAALFSSADGRVDSPNLWQFDAFDDQMGRLMTEAIAPIDTAVMGRRTYEEWSQFWPGMPESDPYASFINPVTKYVASRSLTGDLSWNNSHVADGDIVAFVRGLKEQDGGVIGVQGSLSVVRQLLAAGVLDELTLMVHPVFAGDGRRLFEGEDSATRVTLLDSTTTPAGNALLRYGPRA